MKKITILFIVFLGLALNGFSKANTSNIARPEGYFTNPVNTKYGILASNDLQSSLYLMHDGKVEELISAPGCGRYFTVDKTGSKAGFKLIDPETGLQTPVILDLGTRQLIRLSEAVQEAGQVSFADDGTIVFSLGTQLCLKNGESLQKYDLGIYSNRTPISNDASKVIFKDNDDQLWIFDLSNKAKYKITDSKTGYGNAVWSPDAAYIAYTTTGTDIFVYDLQKRATYSIGQGENPHWSADSKSIVYFKRDIDFNKAVLINSDIYVSSYDGSIKTNVTNTPDINEMDAAFDGNTKDIIYQTYSSGEIKKLSVEGNQQNALSAPSTLFRLTAPLINKVYEIKAAQNKLSKNSSSSASPSATNSAMQWVHVHQVLDTRDNGSWRSGSVGYSACGATTAIEILASFGILKPWPITTYGHNSDYGLYVSDVYTYNNITYNNFTDWSSGAHGYMWNAGGSPYSHIVQFLSNHGVTNTVRMDAPSWSTMAQELSAGNPYVICSTGLTAAHIVLVTAQYGSTHTVVVDDPYGDKNVGSYGSIYNGGNAIYDWSDGNTGHQLITPAAWGVAVRYTPTATPSVLSYSPASATDSIPTASPISVTFSHQMDMTSTEKAFSITPAVPGKFTWSNYNMTVSFKPDMPLAKGSKYTVKIDTSARSFWGKPLLAGVSFSVVTKNRDRLNVVQLYPKKDQSDISTTVQFNIVYDGKVTTYSGAASFSDAKGNKVSLTGIRLKPLDNNQTLLTFDPRSPLEYNTDYVLTLPGTFADAEGYTLVDTIMVKFKTQASAQPDGNILDNFESLGQWSNPSFSGSTVGVDTAASKFAISTDRKRNGQTSGKISYSFSQAEGGVCRVFNAAKPSIGQDNNAVFGIWVFGDLSNNILEYWFYDKASQNKTVTIDTLNWTGWKLKKISLSQINADGDKRFHSLVVKQSKDGNRSGYIYFDDMQLLAVTSVDNNKSASLPAEYALSQNYPNPFNPATTISYSLPKESQVKLKIYNSLGEEIAVLVDQQQPAGSYSVRFDAGNISSGIYFYKIEAGSFTATKKLMLIK